MTKPLTLDLMSPPNFLPYTQAQRAYLRLGLQLMEADERGDKAAADAWADQVEAAARALTHGELLEADRTVLAMLGWRETKTGSGAPLTPSALQARVAELERALLCEQGNPAGAPEGWSFIMGGGGTWAKREPGIGRVIRTTSGRAWIADANVKGDASDVKLCATALEAMRYCDSARLMEVNEAASALPLEPVVTEPDTPEEAARILRAGGYKKAFVKHGNRVLYDEGDLAIAMEIHAPIGHARASIAPSASREGLSWPDSARLCLKLWPVRSEA